MLQTTRGKQRFTGVRCVVIFKLQNF
uniref:Uncharacterized protein n=1 Tax=Arundo donax TaxID=35708 RepID=A0A0A9FTG6_ARUDO